MMKVISPPWVASVSAAICLLFLQSGCKAQAQAASSSGDGNRTTGTWSINRSTFDTSADPCSDFYQYVCGGWAVPANIPPDRPSAWWAQDTASKANDRALNQLLMGKDAIDHPEVHRLRTFFSSCMAQDAKSEQAGRAVLAKWLEPIENMKTPEQFMAVLRNMHAHGVNAFFQYSGEPDRIDKTRYRGEIHQGTLGLNRRLYFGNDQGSKERHQAYLAHITRMFELAGIDPARARRESATVFELEATLAAVSISFSDRFDAKVSEHPSTPKALAELAPHIDWAGYLKMVGSPPDDSLNVTSPTYLQTLDKLLAETPMEHLQAYLRWQFLHALAPALPSRLAEEHSRFYSPPAVQRRPRFDECQLETLKALGVELSRQFSLRFIGPKARDQARVDVERVQEEIAGSVNAIAWLSPAARMASEQKLRQLDLKVGFPDSWPATGAFPLRKGAFLENVLMAQAFEQQRAWSRVRTERRRESWEITVYPNAAPGMAAARLTIPNGFPDVFTNSIILTAAWLRPPLFDAKAPPEVRFATFGSMVSHELVHVLENHEFDAEGKLHDLWSKADIEAHETQRACMVEQADQYVAFDNVYLDGRLTADENIADLSGVPHAYTAMVRELGSRLSNRGADGLTAAQRFFIAYAQQWCTVERPEHMRERLGKDGHAPARFRVNAPLSNMPVFAEAFSCPKKAAMVRPTSSRCVLW